VTERQGSRLRRRDIAAVALVLALTSAGFVVARVLAQRDARRESERRVAVASAQIESRVEVATTLTASLSQFMVDQGARGVTNDQFAGTVLRWLSPAGLPAAAWSEDVPGDGRAAYERRVGRPIVTPDGRRRATSGFSYLPATLVSGAPPMDLRGVDLGRESGIAEAINTAIRPGGVGATPVAARSDGTRGLFLVAPAPDVIHGVLRPGTAVVFLSEATLRAAARNPAGLQFGSAGASSPDGIGPNTVRDEFSVAGRQFTVVMPEQSVSGPGAVLPWVILATGLALAGLAAALGVIAARRARAQRDLDRLFNLSQDLVAVASFDGHFTRVNPAAEQILGYTDEELLARPYLDFVHPDDRERTAAEAAAIAQGRTAPSFENRLRRKDGSLKVLEWTATPVVEDRVMYAAARDVTERRRAEAESARLADEQSALRRVAELVAQQARPEQVFALVTDELSHLLGVKLVRTVRFEADGSTTVVASVGKPVDRMPPGAHITWPSGSVTDQVLRTGRPARRDDYSPVGGPVAAMLRDEGVRCAAGGPIVVDGRLWGAMVVASDSVEHLPPGSEDRVAEFAELVSTGISNIESRTKVERLAAEQSALRRVAELVAGQAEPDQVFALVTEELSRLMEVNTVRTVRFEADGSGTILASSGTAANVLPVGMTVSPLPPGSVVDEVFRTGRPSRVEDFSQVGGPVGAALRREGARCGAGGPIVVDGRLWGAMAVGYTALPLPAGIEDRVARFAELVSTAISNLESRAKIERLAAEQSALRRVATLVAGEHSPDDLFAALAEEIGVLLDVDAAAILRYEHDGYATTVARWSEAPIGIELGERLSLAGENLAGEVLRTGMPQRKEDYAESTGEIAAHVRALDVHSSVASPIVVEGVPWGVIGVLSRKREPLPRDTEARMAEFCRHAGMAVANAKSRSDLAESRARIVRAGDEARRRFERDLHDGAQQRLVSLGLELRASEATVPPELGEVRRVLHDVGAGLGDVLDDLRELSRGLHPAVLSEDGLSPALRSLALRSAVPVDLRIDVDAGRFEEPVEVTAYYVASEALTNTAKHARASRAEVSVRAVGGWLELTVTDDGRGGADASAGFGLTGLIDRVEAIGGSIHVDSPANAGTTIHVCLPTGLPAA
jgi:PAS domain S-box-containing protein